MSAPDAPEGLRSLVSIAERASAAMCFGVPASAGERTVIPVAEVYYGFGFGWGGGTDADTKATGGGAGGGGGSRSRGVAAIELSPTGVVIHPIRDVTSMGLAGITFASVAVAIVARTLLKLRQG